jgi:hypothetical protein
MFLCFYVSMFLCFFVSMFLCFYVFICLFPLFQSIFFFVFHYFVLLNLILFLFHSLSVYFFFRKLSVSLSISISSFMILMSLCQSFFPCFILGLSFRLSLLSFLSFCALNIAVCISSLRLLLQDFNYSLAVRRCYCKML